MVEGPTYAMTPCTYTQIERETAPTLNARVFKDPTFVNAGYSVRRLTPTECPGYKGSDFWCSGLDTPEPTARTSHFGLEVWETTAGWWGAPQAKSRNQIVQWLKNPHSDSGEYKMWATGSHCPMCSSCWLALWGYTICTEYFVIII